MLQLTRDSEHRPQRDSAIVWDPRQGWIVKGHFANARAKGIYSSQLLTLIELACEPYPQRRPTAEVLRAYIRSDKYGMPAVGGPIAAYCTAAEDGVQPTDTIYDWQKGRERYKLWSATDDLAQAVGAMTT